MFHAEYYMSMSALTDKEIQEIIARDKPGYEVDPEPAEEVKYDRSLVNCNAPDLDYLRKKFLGQESGTSKIRPTSNGKVVVKSSAGNIVGRQG